MTTVEDGCSPSRLRVNKRRPYDRKSRAPETTGEEISDLKFEISKGTDHGKKEQILHAYTAFRMTTVEDGRSPSRLRVNRRRPYGRKSRAPETTGEEISDLKFEISKRADTARKSRSFAQRPRSFRCVQGKQDDSRWERAVTGEDRRDSQTARRMAHPEPGATTEEGPRLKAVLGAGCFAGLKVQLPLLKQRAPSGRTAQTRRLAQDDGSLPAGGCQPSRRKPRWIFL